MDSKCRIDADLNQHQEEQEWHECKICKLPGRDSFFNLVEICITCESLGAMKDGVFIDEFNEPHSI